MAHRTAAHPLCTLALVTTLGLPGTLAAHPPAGPSDRTIDRQGLQSRLVERALDVPPLDQSAAPADRIGETAELNDATIFYEAAGDGPAMLLLHGYPLSGALFTQMREALEDRYTVITLDHRGFGNSASPGTPDKVSVFADDALALLDHLGIEEAVIGGMSMGGPIVFDMYRRAPERFKAMILMDTTARPASPAEAGLWRGMAEMVREQGAEPVVAALLPDMLTGETRLNRSEYADFLRTIMDQASEEGAIGGALALADRPDSTPLLNDIDVPTLIVVGQEDAVYPMALSSEMAESIPNAELAIVPGAAHAAVFEAPDHVAAAIGDWSERLE